jgi:actin-like ATPase involved in cell morphogenesis
MNILGIDFGTTKTLAARWDDRTQTPRTIRLGRSGDAIPTTIYADKSGKLEFGEDADDMRALDAAGWKGRIKRDLGRGSAVILNGHRYQVIELISEFLSYVLKRVEEEVFHGPVHGVVVTVPALYGPAERQELHEAARKAGFQSVDLIEEPIAAGLAFLHEKTGTELGEQIFVFDWGGGTLDLALVNYKNGDLSLNQEWNGGDKNLGGEDIDDSIIEGVDTLCATDHGLIDDQDDHRRLQIRRNLKEGKELLSRRSEHTFRLGFKQPVEFKWSRDELECYTATTVNRALDCLRDHLRKLASEGIQPQQVLLIGGASSMPVIKRRIEGEMGIKVILWEHFHTAVAIGAASHAARIISNSQTADSDKRSRPPNVLGEYAKEIVFDKKLDEVTPLVVGTSPPLSTTLNRSNGFTPPIPKEVIQGFIPSTNEHHEEKVNSNHDTKACTTKSEKENDSEQKTLFAKRLEYAWREWWVILLAKYLSAISGICCFLFFIFFVVFATATSLEDRDVAQNMMLFLGVTASTVFLWAKALFKLWRHAEHLTFWLLIPSSLMMFGIIAWLPYLFMFGKKGRYLFSDEYKEIISATPMVKIKIFRGPIIEQ